MDCTIRHAAAGDEAALAYIQTVEICYERSL